jgi:plasmid stabilization system protein ParE
LKQALKYVRDLEASCRSLDDRKRGRVCPPLSEYRRFKHAKHMIFLRRDHQGNVLIVRILHEKMLPGRHLRVSEDE